MEEVKKSYESELQKKNEMVSFHTPPGLVSPLFPCLLSLGLPVPQTLSLQEKLRGATLVCRSADEQNVQLQLSLQQQQAMLTESAARVSELEESQSQLQTQVGLEKKTDRFKVHGKICNSFYFFISPNIRGLMK